MSDYFPKEVLVEILLRLPVRSLLRFRTVSKSWHSLISSSEFVNAHLNRSQSNTNNGVHVLVKYFSVNPKGDRYELRSDTQWLDQCLELQCPFKTTHGNFFRLVGTCNGLICLSDDCFGYTYNIIIWNAAIRRYVTLPRPRVCFDVYGPYMFILGFGFDSRTGDYKVVRLAYLQNRMGSWNTSAGPFPLLFGGKDGYLAPPEVELLWLRTGSWKTIESRIPPYNIVEYFGSSVFVQGTIHWLAYYRRDDPNRSYCNTIVGFDVGGEAFRELKLPRPIVGDYPADLAIAAFEDTLSVFQYDNRARAKRCSVWVMKRYDMLESWCKLYTVNLQEGLYAALRVKKSGELLVVRNGGEVVLYDPRDKGINGLGIRGGRDSYYVGTFAESLVLLQGADAIFGAEVVSCDKLDSEEEPHVLDGQDEEALLRGFEEQALTHCMFVAESLGN